MTTNPSKQRKINTKAHRQGRISHADIALFTRQIATLLSAGVPLLQSLAMIAKGTDQAAVKQLMLMLAEQLAGGSAMAVSLRKHPAVFDDLYCNLVASGELSGSLARVFHRIANYREKSQALRAKITKALVYPAAVIAVALAVTMMLLIYVVPQFAAVFADFGAELPLITQWVIDLAELVQRSFSSVLLALLISVWWFKRSYTKGLVWRDKVDIMALKIPAIGGILKHAAIARFARTLATTFAAGVPLISALECASGAAGNAVYRDAVVGIRDDISAGIPMHVAMQKLKLFPTMAIQLVCIGEQAGALDEMLAKVADIYEREVDDLVDNLTALLEPMIMVVIGVLIGGLIVAMYLPIFSLGKVVG